MNVVNNESRCGTRESDVGGRKATYVAPSIRGRRRRRQRGRSPKGQHQDGGELYFGRRPGRALAGAASVALRHGVGALQIREGQSVVGGGQCAGGGARVALLHWVYGVARRKEAVAGSRFDSYKAGEPWPLGAAAERLAESKCERCRHIRPDTGEARQGSVLVARLAMRRGGWRAEG